MAVDIDSFKKDLDQLKSQRSVIQAKLDEANRHITELTETLKGMGFNSVEEAKQAYVKQLNEAESQHELVKSLIQEINNVDTNIPSREDVMAKLSALSEGNYNVSQVSVNTSVPQVDSAPSNFEQPVVQSTETVVVQEEQPIVQVQPNDFVQQNVISPVVENNQNATQEGSVNLSDILFASL